MSSIYFEDRLEHVTNVNLSHNSADLFEESPQYNCDSPKSPRNRISISLENSSETSEDCSIPRRRPRQALSFSRYSDDSNTSNSNRCSGGLKNDINISSSVFFRPISNDHNTCDSDSSTLEIKEPIFSSPLKNAVYKLSKENVEATTHISESNHSDSSSILDNSLDYGSYNQSSKKSFRTPIYSSVKKRIIHQWLTNVSLNCSHKSEVIDHRKEVSLDFPILGKTKDSKISVNDEFIKSTVEEIESINTVHDSSCHSNVSKNTCSENDFAWLFEVHSSSQDCGASNTCKVISNKSAIIYRKNKSNEDVYEKNGEGDFADSGKNISNSRYSTNGIHSFYNKENNVSSGVESISAFSHDSNSCLINEQSKSSKKLDRSNLEESHENSERNISKTGLQLSGFNLNVTCYKSGDESDSTFDEVRHKNLTHALGDDDSFSKVRFSKKNRNCLNISSDDSEAKDTANDSEDIPNNVVDPYTPKRRLYFRNPLNNSLDDDAKPLIYDKKNYENVKSNPIVKNFDKSKGLLDQICSEVNNCTLKSDSISNNPRIMKNPSSSSNFIENDFHQDFINSEQSTKNKSFDLTSPKLFTSERNLQSDYVLLRNSQGNQLNCSDDQFEAGKTNSDSLATSSYDLSQTTIHDLITKNDSNEDVNKSCISDIHESTSKTPSDFNETADSVLHIKRKSRRNVLNYSTDEDLFNSNEASMNRTNVNEIPNGESSPVNKIVDDPSLSPAKAFVDLTASDNEYDKYIYRNRSDSSCSEGKSDICKGGTLEDVITIHTTTSEGEGESSDDNDSPWFDLESYLKKNVPASSKSLESSFFKNIEKKKAQLAKIFLPTHSSCPEHASFLLSLTPRVPDEMCHPEATKYRGDSFSKNKNELVNLLFKLFNKEIFDEKLPPLEITWSGHLTTTSGITKSSSKITKNGKIRSSCIKLSKTVVDDASKLRDVLLHELCHAANWLIDEQAAGHGPLFKKWVNKIWIKYPEIPKVKTTHRYELKWKYLYKCSYCGYELGKMKLSLDETSCRLCGGSVTVNT